MITGLHINYLYASKNSSNSSCWRAWKVHAKLLKWLYLSVLGTLAMIESFLSDLLPTILYFDAFWAMTSSMHISGAWQTFAVCTSFVTLNEIPSANMWCGQNVKKSPPWRVFLENEWRAKTSWVRLLREDTTILIWRKIEDFDKK